MTVRPERPSDRGAVHAVNVAAFERPAEADLVDRLRDVPGAVSLVAEDAGEVVGHILFTAVTLDPPAPGLDVQGLAPMAVCPDRQRQGVGDALVRAGLAACAEAGGDAVVVLGHPAYYPRFGFRPASAVGLACEYDVPDEAFMALALTDGALDGVEAVVHYHPAFAEVE